ncbi:BTAD domain-containing putative transcriptional regulator [Streptomyces sp. NPDC059740]|uniref:AfsR/SARP family transcriptional regulator n=1 Tax=Streptomyces sp. NPDC059740 TaxID=3346926 RepID=UPI003666C0B7
MRYEILGSLRVVHDGEVRNLSARKKETLLAALLIRAGQVVSKDQLVDELWGETPPRSASAALHVYVSQLRNFLRGHGASPSPIVTRAPGYMMEVAEGQTDFATFRRHLARGRQEASAGACERAVASFEAALGQWRGPALEGLGKGRIVSGFVTWAEELRLECLERWVASTLVLGRDQELIGTLHSLVCEYPLHEEFYLSLMTALNNVGRRADALRTYRRARDVLHTDLGIDPCRRLRDLHQTILRAEELPRGQGVLAR